MTQTNLDQILKSLENTLYSQAIRNYLQKNSENADLQVWLELSNKPLTGVSDDTVKKLNKAIKACKSTGIKYLLLAKQLGMTRFKSDQKAINKKLYLKLIKEFGHIPQSCRKTVGKALKYNKVFNHNGDMKVFRTWSQKHTENELDIIFNMHSNAISLLEKDSFMASDSFYKSSKRSLNQSDPIRILGDLNNAVVCILKTNLIEAIEISEELAYYAGVYSESHQVVLIVSGTLMQIAKQNQDYESFFELASITDYYYEKFTKDDPQLRKLYRPLIRLARKYAPVRRKKTLKRDEVSNTKKLREFLKEKIGRTNAFINKYGLSHTTIYRVLNGDSSVVLIKTLKKFIEALKITPSFENPKEINDVLRVMKAEEVFKQHAEKIVELPEDELSVVLIRGIFITLHDDSLDYCKMLSLVKDRMSFLDYLKKDISRRVFINRCFYNESVFYRGRSALFDKLFEQMDEQTKQKLITLYTALKTNKEIEIINRYLREYSRVSAVNLDPNVEAVLGKRFDDPEYENIFCFCERMKFKELTGYLCTWFFEGEEREQLIRCLNLS